MEESSTEQPESTPSVDRRWHLLGVLFLGAFTTALNVTLLSPLLIAISTGFAVSPATAGLLATVTAASSGLTAVIVAPWMDRRSRAFWLRLECGLLVVGTLISAAAPSFGWLLSGRVIAGIGGAVIGATCLAACDEIFPHRDERNRAVGIISSGFTLGAVFGLPIVTLIADWSTWRWAMAVPIPLAALVFVSANWLPHVEVVRGGSLWHEWRDGYRHVLRSRATVWLLAATLLFSAIWFGWLIYFGAFAETVFAVGPGLLAVLFLTSGFAEMFGKNLAPALLRRWPARAVGAVGATGIAVNLLLVGVRSDEIWTLFAFMTVGGTLGAVLFLSLNVGLLDSLPDAQGAAMSLQSACLEVGTAMGVAAVGVGLTQLQDYAAVYHLLGLAMPGVALILLLTGRQRRA